MGLSVNLEKEIYSFRFFTYDVESRNIIDLIFRNWSVHRSENGIFLLKCN